MSDADAIQVVIEDEDGDASSSHDSIAAADRLAAKYRADAAAANRRTAMYHREAASRQTDSALLTVGSEISAAEAALKDADEMGDTDTKVAATRRIAAGEARRLALQSQADAIQRAPISSGDQFEDYAANFTDRTANWMRDHRDWIVDPKKNGKVTGAHNFAVSEGLVPDSDEYFEFVEKMIGLRGASSNG